MKSKIMFALLILSMLFAGCSNKSSNDANTATETTTLDKLVVQFVPTNNDGSMEAKVKPLQEYLSEKLGMEVEVTMATDYSTIVEAMASGKVHLGIMPPAAYVQARNQNAAVAILTSSLIDYDQETEKPIDGSSTGTFKGEILVRSDSNINSLVDLKGKNIATLNPNSASGYIYPVAEMKEAGIDPTIESNLVVVNDIPSEITALLNGQVDACFVFEGARHVFSSKFADNDLYIDLKVLYLTNGDIPNDAIAVHPTLDEEVKSAIKDAFLNMINDEKGKEAMSLWNHTGYNEVDEKAYDTIEKYTEAAAKWSY